MPGPRRSALRRPPARRSFEPPTRATAPPLPAARQRQEASLSPAAWRPPGASRWLAASATAGSVAVAGSVANVWQRRGGRQPSPQPAAAGCWRAFSRSSEWASGRASQRSDVFAARGALPAWRASTASIVLPALAASACVAQSAHAVSGVFGDPYQRRKSRAVVRDPRGTDAHSQSRERTERGNRTTRHRRFQDAPNGSCRCSIAACSWCGQPGTSLRALTAVP